ncbi:MAG: hypothetical protein ACI8PP_000540 [Candidatus Pseudothioglobus sp.]|jgi:hypothetical protein
MMLAAVLIAWVLLLLSGANNFSVAREIDRKNYTAMQLSPYY